MVAYGEALPESEYPEVQCPEGYYLVWDQTQLNHVTMDCVVTGTFQPYDTLLASRQVRKDDRPALLVEGTFKEGQKLSAELITSADEGSDRKVSTEKLMEHLTPWKKWFLHGEVVEQWKVSCPEDGNEERLLRYYLGDTPAKKLRIFVKRSDGWYPAKISTSGSYVLINMSGETIEFAVMKLK